MPQPHKQSRAIAYMVHSCELSENDSAGSSVCDSHYGEENSQTH